MLNSKDGKKSHSRKLLDSSFDHFSQNGTINKWLIPSLGQESKKKACQKARTCPKINGDALMEPVCYRFLHLGQYEYQKE